MTARWKQWVLNPDHKAVLSFSGGKDSTAMYLLALEQGVDSLPRPLYAERALSFDRSLSPLLRRPQIALLVSFARKRPAGDAGHRQRVLTRRRSKEGDRRHPQNADVWGRWNEGDRLLWHDSVRKNSSTTPCSLM